MSENITVGIHAVTALLKHHPHRILRLARLKEHARREDDIEILARDAGIQIEYLVKERLEGQLSGEYVHQGIVAWVKPEAPWGETELYDNVSEWLASGKKVLLLVLDNVQDPHNLGACFRSAEAFGAHAVVVPRHQSSKLTPVVRKVACGATEILPFAVIANLARTLEQLQKIGLWIVGLDGEAKQPLEKAALTRSCALVMGAEGEGMRLQTQKNCDELAAIPLLGTIGSLNVSVATGVALYEVYKQRHK